MLTAQDLAEFQQGRMVSAHQFLGAHPCDAAGKTGVRFSLWAPAAVQVSVIGSFNGWDRSAAPMQPLGDTGIWECTVNDARPQQLYRFHITPAEGPPCDRRDPCSLALEPDSGQASAIDSPEPFPWTDQDWMLHRNRRNSLSAAVSIYQVHPGSWRRVPEEADRRLRCEEFTEMLAGYLTRMGFTHVVLEGAIDQPWEPRPGLEPATLFAPHARFAQPNQLRRFVDTMHSRQIGVMLDWPVGGFATGPHGLEHFDGSALYEDLSAAAPPGCRAWRITCPEVRSYLLSSALYWLEHYHLDGLRVSGVDWLLGRQRCKAREAAARDFLRTLNHTVHTRHNGVLLMSERGQPDPAHADAAGHAAFGFGIEEDSLWTGRLLDYLALAPEQRSAEPHRLADLLDSTDNARHALAVSRQRLLAPRGMPMARMPGDEWRRFANLRIFHGCQFAHPGKKLTFMGCEFGQWSPWIFERSLDWHLLESPYHRGFQQWIRDLNHLYCQEPALHEKDCRPGGLTILEAHDPNLCIVSLLRHGRQHGDVLVVCNFLPIPRAHYPVGVPEGGEWRELLNSDAIEYGGSGVGNLGQAMAVDLPRGGQPCTLVLTVPPLGMLFLKRSEPEDI